MTTRLITVALAAAAAATASPLAQQKRAPASVIVSCTEPNTIALTFDDGPFDYTDSVLDQLDAAGMKGTFFLNGLNWGSIFDYADTVQRADAEGHQIGSHTWSHPHMPQLSADEVVDEMEQVEDALLDIIGKFPTYMRPPFFEWDDGTLEVLGELGYLVIHADLDTNDWQFDMPASIAAFESGIANGGSLVLAHDVHESTAEVLVPAMISAVQEAGLRAVTVGECLGDAPSNWYRTSRDGSEPEPSETPTPSEPAEPSETPTEPSEPSGTPTDPSEPSATPTDGADPSDTASPTGTDSADPTGTDGADPTGTDSADPTGSATPSDDGDYPEPTGTDGADPTGSDPTDDGDYPEPTGTDGADPTGTDGADPTGSATPTDDGDYPEPTGTDGADPTGTSPSPTDDGSYPEPSATKGPGKGCRAKRNKRNAKKAKKAKKALN